MPLVCSITEECDQLKELASSRLRRSGVSNSITGADEYSDIRTSSGMFFNRGETALIRRVEARVAAWTLLPPGHAEGMQILKYEVGVRLADVRSFPWSSSWMSVISIRSGL